MQVATTPGSVVSVSLEPDAPDACPEAVAAIRDADWVVKLIDVYPEDYAPNSKLGGFELSVGLFDPVNAPGKYERTPLPRVQEAVEKKLAVRKLTLLPLQALATALRCRQRCKQRKRRWRRNWSWSCSHFRRRLYFFNYYINWRWLWR